MEGLLTTITKKYLTSSPGHLFREMKDVLLFLRASLQFLDPFNSETQGSCLHAMERKSNDNQNGS